MVCRLLVGFLGATLCTRLTFEFWLYWLDRKNEGLHFEKYIDIDCFVSMFTLSEKVLLYVSLFSIYCMLKLLSRSVGFVTCHKPLVVAPGPHGNIFRRWTAEETVVWSQLQLNYTWKIWTGLNFTWSPLPALLSQWRREHHCKLLSFPISQTVTLQGHTRPPLQQDHRRAPWSEG